MFVTVSRTVCWICKCRENKIQISYKISLLIFFLRLGAWHRLWYIETDQEGFFATQPHYVWSHFQVNRRTKKLMASKIEKKHWKTLEMPIIFTNARTLLVLVQEDWFWTYRIWGRIIFTPLIFIKNPCINVTFYGVLLIICTHIFRILP